MHAQSGTAVLTAKERGQRGRRHSPSSSWRRQRPCSSVRPAKAMARQPASPIWAAALWPATWPAPRRCSYPAWLGSNFPAPGASGAGAQSTGLGRSRGDTGEEVAESADIDLGGPKDRARAWRRMRERERERPQGRDKVQSAFGESKRWVVFFLKLAMGGVGVSCACVILFSFSFLFSFFIFNNTTYKPICMYSLRSKL
jgi:hypothetical protein